MEEPNAGSWFVQVMTLVRRLYFGEGLKQVEAARRLNVTDRTIRHWLADPVFREYGKTIIAGLEAERAEGRRKYEAEIRGTVQTQKKEALSVIHQALEDGDRTLAYRIASDLYR